MGATADWIISRWCTWGVEDREDDYEVDCLERKVWPTRDGKVIKIIAMDLTHLENCVDFLKAGKSTTDYTEEWLELLNAELTKRREEAQATLASIN